MIQLLPEQAERVKQILSPYPYAFYVYGSRAKNTARSLSDLDICIKSEKPLSIHVLAEIDARFEDSDLPFKVDVREWCALSARFKSLIQKDLVLFVDNEGNAKASPNICEKL